MLVKLDENLGRSHASHLQKSGYQADRVTEEGLAGKSDTVVWQRACEERRFFVTLDTDFADIRSYPPGSHEGILLLRPRNRSSATVLQVLRRALTEYLLESLRGCLTVATESHTRIRRPSFGRSQSSEKD